MLDVGAMLASNRGLMPASAPAGRGCRGTARDIASILQGNLWILQRFSCFLLPALLQKVWIFGKILTGAGVPADTSLLEQTEQNKGAITMRGIYTPVTDIRRKVFTEVARMAYEVNELSDYEKLMRELPFKIIPGEEKSLRSSIFLERAIISERVRLHLFLRNQHNPAAFFPQRCMR